ncbi:MAG TPA: acetyl-CoA hydrolase/transferase C-terminal domain-containing protein [Roseiarcus sp.]
MRIEPDEIAAILPRGGRTLVLACSGESLLLADAVMRAGDALGAMTFTGIFVPGLNTRTYLANPSCRVETFFLTPELKGAGAAVTFLPLCYRDILTRLRTVAIDAALFMASPPDATGLCGFGPVVDFLAELWPRIPVRIAHLNPAVPRVNGVGIPLSELTAYVEGAQPLPGFVDAAADSVTDAIADNVARWIPDGAVLQTGLGKAPTAVLRAVKGRRGLRIHSGLIGEAVVDLQEAGALAAGVAVTGGVAIGSPRLYKAVESSAYEFRPVSHTHAPRVIAGFENFVAINSAMEVDLLGQAYAEMGLGGLMSGPGGASDFARGAWCGGGLRIVALPASAAKGAVSRIVAPNAGAGPVSLGRMDTDIVVTEFGAADLRGRSHQERAEALIAIAPPNHGAALDKSWAAFAAKF